MIDHVVAKYRDFTDFKPKTRVSSRFTTYDLDYQGSTSGLRGFEFFGEGTYTIGPIKVTKKYIPIGCFEADEAKGYGDKYVLLHKS